MQLSDIDQSFRPENAPAKYVLQSFHRALKNRYNYLAFPLITTMLAPLIFRITRFLNKRLSEENSGAVAIIQLFFIMLYINAVDAAISLFSLGTNNRFDPLRNLNIFEARIALRVLTQKVPGIYKDDIYKFIAESPTYANPNLTIETEIAEIDQQSPYTAAKLAKELGAQNIIYMFNGIAYEEKIIFLLMYSFVEKDGYFTKLNRDVFLRILSFIAGNKIFDLKANAPDTESAAVTMFVDNHAKKQRDNLPKLLTYFESKKSKKIAVTSLEHDKPKLSLQVL